MRQQKRAASSLIVLAIALPCLCKAETQKVLDIGFGYSITYHQDWWVEQVNDHQWEIKKSPSNSVSLYWYGGESDADNAELHSMAVRSFIEQVANLKHTQLREQITTPIKGENQLDALDTELAGGQNDSGSMVRLHLTTLKLDKRLLVAVSFRDYSDNDNNVTFAREILGSAAKRAPARKTR
jgi:hypothetical protein